MENEIVINGVIYVKKEEVTETEIEKNEEYPIVNYCGFEWYIIEKSDDNVLLFMKDKLSPKNMKKYFGGNLLDGDCDVPFSRTCDNFWWRDSIIRMYLNSIFLDDLNIDELVEMKTELEFENEKVVTRDFVRLITIEEAKKLPKEILKSRYSYGYWTMSPSYFNGYSAGVKDVYSNGYVDSNDFVNCSGVGVRPVISLKTEYIKEIEKK